MQPVKFLHKYFFFFLGSILLISILLTGCSKKSDPLPKEIYSLTLDKRISGKEAKDFLLRMHQGIVGSDNNEIGFYSGSEGGATIYISYFDDKFQAQAEEKLMTDRISSGTTEFTNGGVFYLDGLKIYKCLGYSQSHFIFSKEEKLIWLTAETSFIRKLVSVYVDHLNK